MSLRLLTEDEVDRFKMTGQIVVGQCHAVKYIAEQDGDPDTFCHKRRAGYRRTCNQHRGLLPFKDSNKKGQV